MARLERARELLDAIDACYRCNDLTAWPAVILDELRRLIPCDTAAFNDIDPLTHRLVVELAPPQEPPPGLEETWARHGHENAAYRRLVEDGDVGPLRLSDLMTQRQLRATDLYRLAYGPLGIRYQLATALEAPRPQITAIILMRGTRDFSNGEVELLRLIRPHLLRSYDIARTQAGIERPALSQERAADRAGSRVVTIDRSSRVTRITEPAATLIGRHFGAVAPGEPMPEPLALWAGRALADRDPSFASFPSRAGVIRASVSPTPDGAIVLLEEQFNRERDPLPLTRRQREVLEAIADGTTNAEAAAALRVTTSTIANHLEAIYSRLGVRNRGAALAYYERTGRRKTP